MSLREVRLLPCCTYEMISRPRDDIPFTIDINRTQNLQYDFETRSRSKSSWVLSPPPSPCDSSKCLQPFECLAPGPPRTSRRTETEEIASPRPPYPTFNRTVFCRYSCPRPHLLVRSFCQGAGDAHDSQLTTESSQVSVEPSYIVTKHLTAANVHTTKKNLLAKTKLEWSTLTRSLIHLLDPPLLSTIPSHPPPPNKLFWDVMLRSRGGVGVHHTKSLVSPLAFLYTHVWAPSLPPRRAAQKSE